jgi:hypothetical protein
MVDFLIDSYGVPEPWGIGDVVYPNEPHNIQQYQVSPENTIFFGRFVVRNFADAYETVMLPPASTAYSALLGISLNTNPFHMLSDGVTKTKAYAEFDTVPVAMLGRFRWRWGNSRWNFRYPHRSALCHMRNRQYRGKTVCGKYSAGRLNTSYIRQIFSEKRA